MSRDKGTTHGARRRRWLLLAAAALIAVTLSACLATQSPAARLPSQPSFLHGLWHGFMAPLSFLISLFTDAVRVYAVPNVGRWYDFGFLLGIGGFSSGIFAGTRRRR
ncbi:MAG: hypothetical protein KF813_12540 [Trueperaceae bacterium]|nr:hypothetical protein [Trueperaceae bacterium]